MTQSIEDRRIISLVRMTVAESVRQVLADPDFGLELTENFKKRLLRYENTKRRRTISLNQIKRKYLE